MDILEEKQVKTPLKSLCCNGSVGKLSDNMWEQTFDALPDFVTIIDSDHRITNMNRAFADRLDGNPEDFIGKTCYSLVHSTEEPPDFCPHSMLLNDSKKHNKKFFIDSLNGYFSVSVSPIFDDGKLKGALHIVHNITEVKTLKESNSRLVTILESSDNTVIGNDLDGTITNWNKGAQKMYGYTAQEMVGRHISVLLPDNIENDMECLLEKISAGESIRNYETVRQCKDKNIIDVSLTISPIKESDGTIIGAAAIAIDITERKKAENIRLDLLESEKKLTRKLQAANKKLKDRQIHKEILLKKEQHLINELQQSNAELKNIHHELTNTIRKLEISNSELQQFAYVASHDLKEPLRMVTSFLQLLKKRYSNQLDDDAKEFIDFAVDGAKRMHNLIEDLLAYSRIITKGKEFTAVNMADVIEQVLINLKVSLDENCAIVTHDPLPTINADESQMIQLLQNLIENSIKYRGENDPRIHINAQDNDEEWSFNVRDNGIGMDPKHTKQIFMIFKRLHTNQEYEGTGIGLAIIKRIVDRHYGNVGVESELGKGSNFFFTISKSEKISFKP